MGKINRAIVVTIFILTAAFVSGGVLAQRSVEPRVVRSVKTETKPNAKIEAIIRKEVDTGDGKEYETRYFYNFVDLNGDKKNEVLVYVEGFVPCGTGGCPFLLLTQNDKGDFEMLNYFSPVRDGVVVSENKTKGWKDLIFQNSGGGIQRSYYSVCRFNGKSYPENPTVEDESPRLKTKIRGVFYLEGKTGIKISPKKD